MDNFKREHKISNNKNKILPVHGKLYPFCLQEIIPRELINKVSKSKNQQRNKKQEDPTKHLETYLQNVIIFFMSLI